MTTSRIDRRALLAGLAATPAALGVRPAAAGEQCEGWLTDDQVAGVQKNRIERAMGPERPEPPYTKAGLEASLDDLTSTRVTTEADRTFLQAAIDHVFEYTNLENFTTAVTDSWQRLTDGVDIVGKTIGSMLTATASKLRSVFTPQCLGQILIKILCGALEGALSGANVGGILDLRRAFKVRDAALGALTGVACATATAIADASSEACAANASS